ncbi:MAG TPA: AzlC family ABC transporter permease [bacterium]|nr:AzlC family ABC transporter permease [bacterium]
MAHRTTSTEFWDGFLQSLPLWMGVAPFGAVYALAARAAGLNAPETIGMSVLVYAGSAQFAAAALFAGGAGALAILLTTFIMNARHILMSASLAPPLRRYPALSRAGAAFVVVDESYAMSVSRVLGGSGPTFLVGAGVSLYLAWLAGTAAGVAITLGLARPGSVGLDLVFPLSFFVLLLPYLEAPPERIAAVVAGGLGLASRLFLPGPWYLLIAAIGGMLAGDASASRGPKVTRKRGAAAE